MVELLPYIGRELERERDEDRREGCEHNEVREASTLTVSRAIFACVSYTSTVKSLLIAQVESTEREDTNNKKIQVENS